VTDYNRDDYSLIGARIKAIREKIGINQKQLAQKLNIANATMCAIEKGHALPSFDVLAKLHDLYNINLYYLFDGSGNIFANEHLVQDYLSHIPPDQAEFLDDFLKLFMNSELVRYSFQAYFKQYKLENNNLIQLDIKSNNTGRLK